MSLATLDTHWIDGVFHIGGKPAFGRPPLITIGGQEIRLETHERYLQSRALRQIAVFHRRGRKTGTTLEKVFKYLILNPKTVGKTLAPLRKQAKEIIWDDPQMLFHPNVLPPQYIKHINKSDLSITLINGSVWTLDGVDDPQKKRGSNVKVLHLTEAGDHEEATWSQIYEPILVANGGIALFEGNPRGKNWYYRLYHNALTRPGWDAFLLSAADSPIYTAQELADLQANTPDAVFRAEYLCEWIDSIGTVFRNYDELMTAQVVDALPGRKYRLAADLGKLQDHSVITGVDRHTWEECFFDRFNAVDWTLQEERFQSAAKAYGLKKNGNSVEFYVESNGVGEPIFDRLWKWAHSPEIARDYDITFVPFHTSNASKAMLVSNLSMLFDERLIRIIKQSDVIRELGAFTYKKNSLTYSYMAPPGEHDDTVMSKMMAFWNLGAKLPLPDLQPEKKMQWGAKASSAQTGRGNIPW